MLDVRRLLLGDAEVPGGEHLPHKAGRHVVLYVYVVVLVQHNDPGETRRHPGV